MFKSSFIITWSVILSISAIGAMTFFPSIEYLIIAGVLLVYALVMIAGLASHKVACRVLVDPKDRTTLILSLLMSLLIAIICFNLASGRPG